MASYSFSNLLCDDSLSPPSSSAVLRETAGKETCIVNVSSLLAVQAEQGLALYCMGKAARNMLHQVIAKEVSAGDCAIFAGTGCQSL